jgi:hypothetical protein
VVILKEVLSLAGAGIHESLERAMGDSLEATNGRKALSKLEPWVRARAVHLLAHNNHAERPFAVMKGFGKIFQTITLSNKSNLSLARCNGTFRRQPEKPKAAVAGAAVTAEPKLLTAVSAVSAVREKSLGKLTVMRRVDTAKDQVKATEHRKTHHAGLLKEADRLAEVRALKSDAANSTAPATTEAELDAKLAAKTGKGTKVELLGKQITARQEGGRGFKYPQSAVGMANR